MGDVVGISIHAPTWGATLCLHCKYKQSLFQSTHPRGVRHKAELANVGVDDFNPRTHVGCDLSVSNFLITTDISIHAPTWGATSMGFDVLSGAIISIHAPTWGATQTLLPCLIWSLISIHAPTWGATMLCVMCLTFRLFQSTHPRGVRLLSHQMVGF